MSTALAIMPDGPSQEIAHAIAGTIDQLKAIRTFIKAEFDIGYKTADGKIVVGKDAGLIPGCGDKPTLFLPGAQKATMYFNCRPSFKIRETDLGNGHVKYQIRCVLISRASREEVGEGVGCCSTMEKKYRWRGNEKVCPSCGKPTIRKSKDKPEFYCWRKIDGCGATFGLKHPDILSQGDGTPVENTDLYDLHNTVLKMAKKRAHVDAAMTLGCLSELFTQDIEDTYGAVEVREAARPYEGEIVQEARPAPKFPDQGSGHGKTGSYATPDQVKASNALIKGVGEERADAWHDAWHDANGVFPAGLATFPFTKAVVARTMLEAAIAQGKLQPVATTEDAETGRTVPAASVEQTLQIIAIVHARDPEWFEATLRGAISREMCRVANAFAAENPHLTLPHVYEEFDEIPDAEDESQDPEPTPPPPAPAKLSKKELAEKVRLRLIEEAKSRAESEAVGAQVSDDAIEEGRES